MPIYEYACTDCGHELEVLQKINDLPPEQCPTCGKNTLKKRISATAFHLKGTGWYKTDFKDKDKKKPEPKEKKPETSSTASSSTKKDTNTTASASTD